MEAKLENTVRAAIPQMIAEMPLEEDCENENGEDEREEIELALRKQRILKKPDEFSEEKDLNTCTSTNSMSSTIAMSGPPEVTRAVLMTQGWVVSISKLGTARSRLYRSQILQVLHRSQAASKNRVSVGNENPKEDDSAPEYP